MSIIVISDLNQIGSAGKRFAEGSTTVLPLIKLDNRVAIMDKKTLYGIAESIRDLITSNSRNKENNYTRKISQRHDKLENILLDEINPLKFQN
jgi:hypothetical protein